MLQGILLYLPIKDNIGFLQFKKDYLHILPWKLAFYAHIFSIIFTLLAGFTQFSKTILKDHKKIHRLVGKIYVFDIFLNFPIAFVMGIYANGLWPTKIAFILLDCLWVWVTYKALHNIRKGNVVAHRAYMIRSYALTLSAVSLRFWKIVILAFIDIDPLPLYMINAWLGFVPNLLFAEWLIRRKKKLSFKPNVVKD